MKWLGSRIRDCSALQREAAVRYHQRGASRGTVQSGHGKQCCQEASRDGCSEERPGEAVREWWRRRHKSTYGGHLNNIVYNIEMLLAILLAVLCTILLLNWSSNIAQYYSQYRVKYCEQYPTIIYTILYNIKKFHGQYHVQYCVQYWTILYEKLYTELFTKLPIFFQYCTQYCSNALHKSTYAGVSTILSLLGKGALQNSLRPAPPGSIVFHTSPGQFLCSHQSDRSAQLLDFVSRMSRCFCFFLFTAWGGWSARDTE